MTDYSKYKTVLVEKDNGVATVTLNRPSALNAVNPDMNDDFDTLFRDLSADEEIDAIVLTGAGRAFCAGGDIKNMDARNEASARDFPMDPRDPGRLLNDILDVQQPIIAAINGDAIGLGATIALFCDIQVAAETARLADTHVRIGVVAGDGGASIWPPLINPNRAKEFPDARQPDQRRRGGQNRTGQLRRAAGRSAAQG